MRDIEADTETAVEDRASLYIYHLSTRGGGLGSRPKKMHGERLGDGVEYHLMSPTPLVKYHLRRGVGLMKFLKMVLDPSPPPLGRHMCSTHLQTPMCM